MTAEVYAFGPYRLLPSARELWRGDERVELPRHTFECLHLLITRRERAVGRDELVQAIFRRANVSDAQLSQIVLRSRRAVDDDGATQAAIRTIVGYGYRWVAPTRVLPAGPDEDGIGGRPPDHVARRPRRRWFALAAAALVVAAAGLAVMVGRRTVPVAPPAPHAAVVARPGAAILPIDVDGLDEDAWMRLGAMDLLAERLREAGFRVPPSESVLGLLSGASAETDAPALLLRATGAGLVVRGRAARNASGWQVELVVAAGEQAVAPVTFFAQDAVPAIRGAADRLLAALDREIPVGGVGDMALDETLRRARAALLANELDTARTLLVSSAELARRPGRLAFRLAQVDYRAGRLDAAEAALSEVLGQAFVASDRDFHAQVLNMRGATRLRRGDFDAGGRDYEAALALLGEQGDIALRSHARVGRANARVSARRFDEAATDFALARIDLDAIGDRLSMAAVDLNLGLLELHRGRPAAALVHLPGAIDRLQAFGALHELLNGLTGLTGAQLAMLQRDAALASLARGWALRARVTDPGQQAELLLDRAQVFIGAGRHREAQAALDQVAGIAASSNRGLPLRRRVLDALLALAREQWGKADAAIGAVLAEWPAAGAEGYQAELVLLRQRALLAQGRIDDARALLDRSRAVPPTVTGAPDEVADALAMAEWAAQAGDGGRAAAWFGVAGASADRRGVPSEIAAAALAHGTWLLAAGAVEKAAPVIARVSPWVAQDFDCALLQLRLSQAQGRHDAWLGALRHAQATAGERAIPVAWRTWVPAPATAPVHLGAALP